MSTPFIHQTRLGHHMSLVKISYIPTSNPNTHYIMYEHTCVCVSLEHNMTSVSRVSSDRQCLHTRFTDIKLVLYILSFSRGGFRKKNHFVHNKHKNWLDEFSRQFSESFWWSVTLDILHGISLAHTMSPFERE